MALFLFGGIMSFRFNLEDVLDFKTDKAELTKYIHKEMYIADTLHALNNRIETNSTAMLENIGSSSTEFIFGTEGTWYRYALPIEKAEGDSGFKTLQDLKNALDIDSLVGTTLRLRKRANNIEYTSLITEENITFGLIKVLGEYYSVDTLLGLYSIYNESTKKWL